MKMSTEIVSLAEVHSHSFRKLGTYTLPNAISYNSKDCIVSQHLQYVKNLLTISNIYGIIFFIDNSTSKYQLLYTYTNSLLQQIIHAKQQADHDDDSSN